MWISLIIPRHLFDKLTGTNPFRSTRPWHRKNGRPISNRVFDECSTRKLKASIKKLLIHPYNETAWKREKSDDENVTRRAEKWIYLSAQKYRRAILPSPLRGEWHLPFADLLKNKIISRAAEIIRPMRNLWIVNANPRRLVKSISFRGEKYFGRNLGT